MTSLVGGAALGPPFQMLFDIVVKIPLEKTLLFKSMLIKIRRKVHAMEPLIEQLKNSNMALDLPSSETDSFIVILKVGKKLVDDCTNYSKWQYIYKRPRFTSKLQKLDEDLGQLLQILSIQTAKNVAETRNLVTEILDKIGSTTQISNDVVNKQIEIKGCCQALEPPAFTVGLDKPLEELKTRLLKVDNSTVPIVVTAPPGCGKTTLAKKLCKDDKIKGTPFS